MKLIMECFPIIAALYKNCKFVSNFVPQDLFASIEIESRENKKLASAKLLDKSNYHYFSYSHRRQACCSQLLLAFEINLTRMRDTTMGRISDFITGNEMNCKPGSLIVQAAVNSQLHQRNCNPIALCWFDIVRDGIS